MLMIRVGQRVLVIWDPRSPAGHAAWFRPYCPGMGRGFRFETATRDDDPVWRTARPERPGFCRGTGHLRPAFSRTSLNSTSTVWAYRRPLTLSWRMNVDGAMRTCSV